MALLGIRRLVIFAVALAAVVACGPTGTRSASTTLSTTDGLLHGRRAGAVVQFLGVPYARPPVGALRWAPPQAPEPWPGTRQATRSGPSCPQPGSSGSLIGQEGCLHLDVTVPGTRSDHPRPVMVWLHGGGFSVGSGSDDDPTRLASEGDVDVVTVDFRLGVMANLALPQMTDGGSYGLQDQRAALEWVQHNAAAFGGDPRNVTLFGQSGGGVAVCGQLASPAARNLFDKAILQSGSCATTLAANASGPNTPAQGTFWRPLPAAQAVTTQVAARHGCTDPGTALACLRRLPDSVLLTDSGSATAAAYGTPALPADPATNAPAISGIAILSGTTHDEQRLVAATYALLQQPISAATYPGLLSAGFGATAPAVAARYPVAAFGSPAYAWAAAYTDSGFVCPQLATDDRLSGAGDHVYGYEFDDPTAPPVVPSLPGFAAGASHASELYYLFDVTPPPTRIDGSHYGLDAAQRRVASTMIGAWSTFARTGHPGPDAAWPAWGTSTTAHQFTAGATPSTTDLAATHHCRFWQTTEANGGSA